MTRRSPHPTAALALLGRRRPRPFTETGELGETKSDAATGRSTERTSLTAYEADIFMCL
jgi:hypothetical protein